MPRSQADSQASPRRVVVSFRGVASLETVRAPSYLDRALEMKQRAEALGATLCAWSAQTFSFDFAPEDLEEAVSLALLAVSEDRVTAEERFGVGLSEGTLDVVGDGGSLAVLSWGRPLLIAVSLARVALAGQVLLDPDLPAVRSGELLVASARVAMDVGRRVRGLLLDAAQPWRRLAATNVARLVTPSLLGLDALDGFLVQAGTLGLIRAEAGAGGTRLLSEATARLTPSRALFIGPVGASREPLGALRRALSRSAMLYGAPTIPERLHGALDRLLAGDGADLQSVAEIVDTWLAPDGAKLGVLALDDAREVDTASLQAIAGAVNVRGGFRTIARLAPSMPMPEPLAGIAIAASLEVPPLTRERGERMVASFASGNISLEAAERWAKRGGATPLGIREALAEGLTSGELAWNGPVAVARGRSAGRGTALPAKRWIERRMLLLPEDVHTVLTALALLGGGASDAMIDALTTAMAAKGSRGARVSATIDTILASGLAARPEPGWLKLSSRSAEEALAGVQQGDAGRAWHAAAALTIEQHGGLLGRADAAWHASVAGDRALAARLAIDAAAASMKAGLDASARSLLSFARDHDAAQAEAARLLYFRADRASMPAPPSMRSSTLDGHEDAIPIPSEPRPRFDTLVDDSMFNQFEPASAASPAAPLARPVTIPSPAPAPPVDAPSPTLAARAKEALVQGDVATLEEVMQQLRLTGAHSELIDRMNGMLELGRGAKEEALRTLRAATEVVDQPIVHRARALLAYGVALAASGRTEGALLETLTALARAREAGDRQGEHACARFLARLSSAAGHAAAASAWAKVAQLSVEQTPG